jgi:homospermidine synthase
VYRNAGLPPAQRTSHALRQSLHDRVGGKRGPTALVGHGANPGLVSHFTKAALARLATDTLEGFMMPRSQAQWASLARTLGVKVIHVTERDTQAAAAASASGEFVNTWSPEGLIDELCQPAEFGWGTHERNVPPDASAAGCEASRFLTSPGAATLMRSWTPGCGPYQGFLLSHAESLTIADFYTVRENAAVQWRPTVKFIYRPCDDALVSIESIAAAGWTLPSRTRVLLAEIVQGADELGVLLMGPSFGSLWFGSRLSASEAQSLAPSTNATTLQVAAGILGGLVWLLENPRVGLTEPEEVDHERVLGIARPYLGELHCVYTRWTPLDNNPAGTDHECPWQFGNFRVVQGVLRR